MVGMTPQLTQDTRIGEFRTPLGKDTLVLTRFDGVEGLSELFEYRIEAISLKEDIDFDGAIGQNCSVTLKTYGSERHFNGVLVEAQWLGMKDVYYAYRLVLRPQFWLLSRTADCRIFSNKKAPDIIREVLNDFGIDNKFALQGSFPELEYCVQYRETHLAFISRLMEQHGIYYFFKHTTDKHTMHLANGKSSHEPVPGHASTPFVPLAGDDRRDREHIYHWSSERRFRTGKVEFNDYDFKQPGKKLLADTKASEKYTKSDLKFYDHPGKYTERDVGETYTKIQLEAEQSLDHRRHATGDAASLFPGGLTKLEKHSKDSENEQYLIVRAQHSFVSEFYRTGADVAPGQVYYGNYEFQKSDRPFRAQIVTPKPQVLSMHTAKVAGKDGEEIDTDEYGRIRVNFYWDQRKEFSRWMRVAHMWASKQWGTQFIPRVGMEVVVAYEEGDPDFPLVVGAVYNGDNKHPYKLPDNKTQSGFKSNSSKGGNGYNEFMFEDLKGSELIRMHAQKDYDVTVHHVETRKIGEDGVAGASRDTTLLTGDDVLKVATGNQNVTVAMSVTEKYGISHSTTVGASQSTTVGGPISITSAALITLTCGASSIVMTPASITITSPTVQILGSANVLISGPIKSDIF
jgi:type VI secretion system secreted protein VgrG